jgi:hypothetical protein
VSSSFVSDRDIILRLHHTMRVSHERLYQGKPLRSVADIRLLELDVSSPDEVIRGQLLVVTLEKAPPYHALSHTWGKPLPEETVHVDGHELRVGLNLHAALRRLRTRSDFSPPRIRIDALCINQDDDAEKSTQVAMMSDIYARAKRVYMWLGEKWKWTNRAFAIGTMCAAAQDK